MDEDMIREGADEKLVNDAFQRLLDHSSDCWTLILHHVTGKRWISSPRHSTLPSKPTKASDG